jgi:hypothetical protein
MRGQMQRRGFLLEMGAAGGGSARVNAEATWTVGGSPIDYHNALLNVPVQTERVDALIAEWCAALEARGLPGVVHWSPGLAPPDLPARLLRHGLHLAGEER